MQNKCIKCSRLGEKCCGPNLLALPLDEVGIWLKRRAAYLHVSYEKLEMKSSISKSTIYRIFNGQQKDCDYSTLNRLIVALVSSPLGKVPCIDSPVDLEERCRQLEEKNAELEEKLKKSEEVHANNTADLRKEVKAKRIAIIVLAILAFALMCVIGYALYLDGRDPNVGFIWRIN